MKAAGIGMNADAETVGMIGAGTVMIADEMVTGSRIRDPIRKIPRRPIKDRTPDDEGGKFFGEAVWSPERLCS